MTVIKKHEKQMLAFLNAYINNRKIKSYENIEWENIDILAHKHILIPFLYEYVDDELIEEGLKDKWQKYSQDIVKRNYHLLFTAKYVLGKLSENGIDVVVLKGVGIAALYPVPEIRKSGDVDLLLLDNTQMDKAVEVLAKYGFDVEEKQSASHHVELRSPEGIIIEVHSSFSEKFEDDITNKCLDKMIQEVRKNVKSQNCMGIDFLVLEDGYQAFHLLIHMLQHFWREGFGIRMLADWVVFWNREISEKQVLLYKNLVHECGLEGFEQMITGICHYYLGLKHLHGEVMQKRDCDIYLREILDAGEFGRSQSDRMVVMNDKGIAGYIKTFWKQVKVNYPKYSKVIALWPILCVMTFIKFTRNNKRLNRPSILKILRKADDRSKIITELNLFKRMG